MHTWALILSKRHSVSAHCIAMTVHCVQVASSSFRRGSTLSARATAASQGKWGGENEDDYRMQALFPFCS